MSKKCVVRVCPNRTNEGEFVESLCRPCWDALNGNRSEASMERILDSMRYNRPDPHSLVYKSYASYSSMGASIAYNIEDNAEHIHGYYGFEPRHFGFTVHENTRFRVTVEKLDSPDEKPLRNFFKMVVFTAQDGTEIKHLETCKALDKLYESGAYLKLLTRTSDYWGLLHWPCISQRTKGDSRHTWVGKPKDA